jgi:acyl-coenzyme A synthetase/AMP-(fatty) acid ligase
VQRSRAARDAFGLAGGSIVGTVPPQHMYGFELTVLLPLHAPVCSWCGPGFFPGDVAAALDLAVPPSVLVTTPLQLRALLHGGVPLPVSGVISATAPLDTALAAQAEDAWRTEVREVFGATECGSIASRRTTAGPDWTVYPGVSVGFADAGAVVDAPHMGPVALSDVFEAAPGGFRLLGRRTDVVKLGGRRASLPGLNQVLTGLPGVEDGAFIVPDDLDDRSTARLLAVVVAPGRTAAAILAELRLVLDPVFLPRRVIQVERMPRNDLGKLPRLAMLELVAQAGAAP